MGFQGVNTSVIIGISLGLVWFGQLIAYAISEYELYKEHQERLVWKAGIEVLTKESAKNQPTNDLSHDQAPGKLSEVNYRETSVTEMDGERKGRGTRTDDLGSEEEGLLRRHHKSDEGDGEEGLIYHDGPEGGSPGLSGSKKLDGKKDDSSSNIDTSSSTKNTTNQEHDEAVRDLWKNIEEGNYVKVAKFLVDTPTLWEERFSREIGGNKYENFTPLQYALALGKQDIVMHLLAENEQIRTPETAETTNRIEINSVAYLNSREVTAYDLFQGYKQQFQSGNSEEVARVENELNDKGALPAARLVKPSGSENRRVTSPLPPSTLSSTASILQSTSNSNSSQSTSTPITSASSATKFPLPGKGKIGHFSNKTKKEVDVDAATPPIESSTTSRKGISNCIIS